MKRHLIATSIAVGVLGIGSAHAMPNAGAMFDKLDSNGDGQVNAQELQQLRQVSAQQRFDAVDVDGNDKISQEEFTMEAKEKALAVFSKLDQNGDNSLTTDELMADKQHGSDRGMKHDKRGAHDSAQGESKQSEGQQMAGGQDKSQHQDKKKMSGDHDKSHANGDKRDMKRAEMMIQKMDQDGDDQVSREEWNQAMQKHSRGMNGGQGHTSSNGASNPSDSDDMSGSDAMNNAGTSNGDNAGTGTN